jgi:hypothetical protein
MNTRNKTILEQEMSTELMVTYIQEEMASVSILANNSENKEAPKVPPRFLLANRFPVSLWEQAASFFSYKEPEPTPEEIELHGGQLNNENLSKEEIPSSQDTELPVQEVT